MFLDFTITIKPTSFCSTAICIVSFLQLYKEQAGEMGFDACHLFLRCVQFEFASHKENADQPPPLFITALHEDDTNVDRYSFISFLEVY